MTTSYFKRLNSGNGGFGVKVGKFQLKADTIHDNVGVCRIRIEFCKNKSSSCIPAHQDHAGVCGEGGTSKKWLALTSTIRTTQLQLRLFA